MDECLGGLGTVGSRAREGWKRKEERVTKRHRGAKEQVLGQEQEQERKPGANCNER